MVKRDNWSLREKALYKERKSRFKARKDEFNQKLKVLTENRSFRNGVYKRD